MLNNWKNIFIFVLKNGEDLKQELADSYNTEYAKRMDIGINKIIIEISKNL